MNNIIAIVDDEPDILELVALNLKKAGFSTKEFKDGNSFLDYTDKDVPALIILDLMLPDIDGLEICKILRSKDAFKTVPIIMLTAKSEEIDKVVGLELGADDYVTKPFSSKELIARVKAVLRRKSAASDEATKKIEIQGKLVIDLDRYEVLLNGKKVSLTSTEFRILQLLSSKPGKVFTRDQILDHLWGEEKIVVDRTVDVHIRHLREKLGRMGQIIKNIRSVGYKLEE